MDRPFPPPERTLQFEHNWISVIDVRTNYASSEESKILATVHNRAVYRWFGWILRGGHDIRSGRADTEDVKLSFSAYVNPDYYDARVPVALDCLFKLVVKHPRTHEVVMEAEQMVLPSYPDNESLTFDMPLDSDFGQKLNNVYRMNGRYIGYITEISTTVTIPSSAFHTGYHTIPTDVPVHQDFQRERNDFTIHSKDGKDISTNKFALVLVSPYFSSFFKRVGPNATSYNEPGYSYDAIKTVITYITTGVFPDILAELTPPLAVELRTLAFKYMGSYNSWFYCHLENLTIKTMNKRRLSVVVEWLVTSSENEMYLVQNICLALILTKFDRLFRINYEGPDVAPSRRDVANRLSARGILNDLEEIRNQSEHVTMTVMNAAV